MFFARVSRSVFVIPCLASFYACAAPIPVRAQQTPPPAKKTQDSVRPMPPPGMVVSDADRKELTDGAEALGREINALRAELPKTHPNVVRFLPDVQIFHNAVRYAVTYNEFYNPREVETARKFLTQGRERVQALRNGSAPWTTQTGLQVFGYVSKIDGSVQPYGLLVPPEWKPGDTSKRRMDFFCHGRGETLTELAFLNERESRAGEFSPPGAFVLQPYGRYCCANRFAGEVDLFEALADAKSRYSIDNDRLVMRGFSMGGASCWQFASHHASSWAAAAPGAGFSETIGFLHLDASALPTYEQKLLHWYDSTDYAVNLAQCPTVAYNGDMDGQKQAADKMEEAITAEGLMLTRVIGPKTGHWYEESSKPKINAFVDAAVEKGRDKLPAHLRFTTWTLRYNQMAWLTVTGLGKHWERARVTGDVAGNTVTLATENVTRLQIAPEAGRKTVVIDGQKLTGLRFVKNGGKWAVDKGGNKNALTKKPGLQGPIDDAFMNSFVFVRPTQDAAFTPETGTWTTNEMAHAAQQWRAVFRGEARMIDDKTITDTNIAQDNLVLWGDPKSNAVLAKIASKLPITWDKDGTVRANGKTYPAGTTVPVFIYPNPLNPARYVVVNSGITFREAALLNNAEQRAKLPDWAIVDIMTPPSPTTPGHIAGAGFFDENWRFVK